MTSTTLKSKLLSCLNRHALENDKHKVRQRIEDKLVPWVVANLFAFPELVAEQFIFINLMPVDKTSISSTLHSLMIYSLLQV
jgi:hypothetical protein